MNHLLVFISSIIDFHASDFIYYLRAVFVMKFFHCINYYCLQNKT